MLLLSLNGSTANVNGPASQASHPLLSEHLFIVLARVASSLCLVALLLHVLLFWPTWTRYPCIQQYLPRCTPPCMHLFCWAVGTAGAQGELVVSIVYATVRGAMLAVSEVMLTVSVALFSMSCRSVVHLVDAAATKLSKLPSRWVKVSREIEVLSAKTAWASPQCPNDFPNAKSFHFWASRWATW